MISSRPQLRCLAIASVVALAWLAAPAASAEMGNLKGLYEVEGVTIVPSTGDERRAAGRIIVEPEGEDAYTTTFNLKTAVRTPEGTRNISLTGFGAGRTEGDKMTGTAETQWLMAAIPGLDPQFPWIPGRLGPRIESTFEMVAEDRPGEYRIEIRSHSKDTGYPPTETTLRATLVTDEVRGKLPLPEPHPD